MSRKLNHKTSNWTIYHLPGATWSPTSFIVDDGMKPDGLNLGSVVVDEEVGSVILIYDVCFYLDHCSPPSIMMVESWDDGLSWTPPRNLSVTLGVKNFIPGPGLGLQVRESHVTLKWVNFSRCKMISMTFKPDSFLFRSCESWQLSISMKVIK